MHPVARHLTALPVMLLLLTGCSASFTTANVQDARLARDAEGADQTTVFRQDETFHCLGRLANAPDGTRLRAVWTAVRVDGEEPNTELGEKEVESSGGDFHFDLTNDSLWPEGAYSVALFVNDEPATTLVFEVTADGATRGAETAREGAVTSLFDVKGATIQIEAQGSFMDPEVGLQLNAAGSGSGFIIDPSGIAVTNNHVVTGAAILQVYVGGEREPRNARILAVSECSDLAVIDIDGEGFPFLEWYEGEIRPALRVYAAGFPLGDPEYTLTEGIVSKERANGDTNWASVDRVIQHDASINPGNSGGPLVDENGRVVAVNYAGANDVNQYFAIRREEALKVIDQLRSRQDVTSIGVNGTAVTDGESISGIWVSSVKSGSAADDAGIKGGDIITKLEGLVLSTDGTMADYCDILRGHEPDDVLRVEVLRFETMEVLEGQLNGRQLTQSFSFARDESEAAAGGDSAVVAESYTRYVSVEDDSGAIVMEVPAEWNDIDGTPWTKDDVTLGPSIMVATDIDGFNSGYSTPGAFFGASESLAAEYDPAGLLDFFADDMGTTSCTAVGRQDYEDPFYTGVFEVYNDCGDTDTSIIAVSAVPEDSSFILFLLVQVVSSADLEALDKIIDTFQAVGDLE